MRQPELVPTTRFQRPLSISVGILGILIGCEFIAAIVVYDWFAFHHLPLTLSIGILTFEAEAAVAVGILLEVWLHWAEVRAKAQPAPNPPTLSLTVHDSEGDFQEVPHGPILAVTNYGPGVAKNLTLEYFGYPESPAAKAFWTPRNDTPATCALRFGHAILNVGENRRWILTIPRVFDVETEYIIEIHSDDLYNRPMAPVRFQAGQFKLPGLDRGGEPRWHWQVRLDTEGRPVVPPPVSEMRERGLRVGPPHFWDLD